MGLGRHGAVAAVAPDLVVQGDAAGKRHERDRVVRAVRHGWDATVSAPTPPSEWAQAEALRLIPHAVLAVRERRDRLECAAVLAAWESDRPPEGACGDDDWEDHLVVEGGAEAATQCIDSIRALDPADGSLRLPPVTT